MEIVFADAFYYIAWLNDRDVAYPQARAMGKHTKQIITTDYVLLEVADALAETRLRADVVPFIESLRHLHTTLIVPASQDLLNNGLKLYANRLDKGWSLTDCISFVVMRNLNLTVALTHDHHFKQAGFRTLL